MMKHFLKKILVLGGVLVLSLALAAPVLAAPEAPAGDEPVVLQGSVDCTFIENGRLNIIDFKTDRVEDMEELWRRYILQLKLYAYAMREVTGLAIGEMFLYSTWLSEGSGKLYDETETA